MALYMLIHYRVILKFQYKERWKMKTSTEKSKQKSFTLIEIMMVVVIIGILATLLMPLLSEAKAQAKYARWLAFNRNCSNDPSCVINFNFQGDGGAFNASTPGDILVNSSAGTEAEGFSPQFYNGHLMNKNGGDHNFEWVRAGRYGKFKWALQFNGSDTYVVVPTTTSVDFTPFDGFTLLCWVKFDKLDFGDCIFSKSLWGTAKDASCQYDMYYNPFVGAFSQGSFDIDAFTTCGTWDDTEVNFEKAGWIHFVLRYEWTHNEADGTPKGEITAFINGKPLGDFKDTTNENPQTTTASGYQACIDMQVPLILGGAGCYTKYWDTGNWDPNDLEGLANNWVIKFNFQGKMDEFLVYKRPLSNSEISAQYDMGTE
jgi:prepilin-type N-terminal cleavage/methylation domain-containing protein